MEIGTDIQGGGGDGCVVKRLPRSRETVAGRDLVGKRPSLRHLSALETYYAGLRVGAQCGAACMVG